MSLNPYQPVLITLEDSDEDSLWEGMKAYFDDDLSRSDFGIVIAIKNYDVDVDGDGGHRVFPTEVQVQWVPDTMDDIHDDWFGMDDVTFLKHQVEAGRAAYEARMLIRKYKVECRPTMDGYRYYGGWRGAPVVTSEDFIPIDHASQANGLWRKMFPPRP